MPIYAVPITLADGKPRTLRYDWNALEALEDEGVVIDKLQAIMTDPHRRLRNIRLIMWAGLIHEDETLTPKAVGRLMSPVADMSEWVEKISEAFTLAFGIAKDGELKNATAPVTGTAPGTGESI